MGIRRHLFFSLALLANAASAQAQDKLVALGDTVFTSSCKICHAVGDRTTGTQYAMHLNNLFGRTPGGLSDAVYSLAMVRFGKEHVWDEPTLSAFLRDPKSVVPDSNMKFAGLKKDEEIKALLAFLATFDEGGMAPK